MQPAQASKRRDRSHTEPDVGFPLVLDDVQLPPNVRSRLNDLFMQISKEFEVLHLENLQLKQKLLPCDDERAPSVATVTASTTVDDSADVVRPQASKKSSGGLLFSQRLKTGTNKLVHTLKPTPPSTSSVLRQYLGGPALGFGPATPTLGCAHLDGIWEATPFPRRPAGAMGPIDLSAVGAVAADYLPLMLRNPLLVTASADKTARIWSAEHAKCVLVYKGHMGSVNSARFSPWTADLVLSASGDRSVHLWRLPTPFFERLHDLDQAAAPQALPDPEPFRNLDDSDAPSTMLSVSFNNLNTAPASKEMYSITEFEKNTDSPIQWSQRVAEFNGHDGTVWAADWLQANRIVTAGADRISCVYDVETGQMLHKWSEHDGEITNVCCHADGNRVLTCSKDAQYKLWDVRQPDKAKQTICCHAKRVSCAVFGPDERIISASDDRTVKLWDTRKNSASPVTIKMDAPVNRLAVSSTGVIAVPLDNRSIHLYSFNGTRLGRLPRTNRQGHTRLVSSVCWVERFGDNCGQSGIAMDGSASVPSAGSSAADGTSAGIPSVGLVSAGFDGRLLGWAVPQVAATASAPPAGATSL